MGTIYKKRPVLRCGRARLLPQRLRVAVFAHNVQASIRATLQSIIQSSPYGSDLRIYVLANGCTDRTLEHVREFQTAYPFIIPVVTSFGDKACTWNKYVYDYADESPCHFFMDGDVQCTGRSLE